jgi:hypothetical protein
MSAVRRLALVASALLLLAACGVTEPRPDGEPPAADVAWLAEHGLDGLGGKAVVDRLDAMPVRDRPDDLMASVGSHDVLLTDDDGREATLPLPQDAFYLSVAPYVSSTHPCELHSLTTCRGELAGQEVSVLVTDAEGATVLATTTRTFDNGFVGLWLPRDLKGTIRIERDGAVGSAELTTGEGDPTCLTAVHLT